MNVIRATVFGLAGFSTIWVLVSVESLRVSKDKATLTVTLFILATSMVVYASGAVSDDWSLSEEAHSISVVRMNAARDIIRANIQAARIADRERAKDRGVEEETFREPVKWR